LEGNQRTGNGKRKGQRDKGEKIGPIGPKEGVECAKMKSGKKGRRIS